MKTQDKSILEVIAEESNVVFDAKLPALVLSCLAVIKAGKYGCLWGNNAVLRNNWGLEGCQNFVNEFFGEEHWSFHSVTGEQNSLEGFCKHCGELEPGWLPVDDAEFNSDGILGKILHPCKTCGEER